LWDTALLPDIQYATQRQSLALPKLGLQFLSFRDYLLRSFELYRLASAYDVRLDINDAIRRLAPRLSTQRQLGTLNTKETRTELTGIARMVRRLDYDLAVCVF
jgi:intron-binding protein aquarius